MADQPNAPRPIPAAAYIPQITALSIAFPLNFESPEPTKQHGAQRANGAGDIPTRNPHRHDAGE